MGATNLETQRSYPDFFVRRNGQLSKAESAQARATDRVFSRHLLARACKAPRLCRSPLMCAAVLIPRTPLRTFHQLLFLPRRSALAHNPCSRRANLTFCTCLLAQGWQSTPMVPILNRRGAAAGSGCYKPTMCICVWVTVYVRGGGGHGPSRHVVYVYRVVYETIILDSCQPSDRQTGRQADRQSPPGKRMRLTRRAPSFAARRAAHARRPRAARRSARRALPRRAAR